MIVAQNQDHIPDWSGLSLSTRHETRQKKRHGQQPYQNLSLDLHDIKSSLPELYINGNRNPTPHISTMFVQFQYLSGFLRASNVSNPLC